MKICICKLPHAGLGNKLFVWAQGVVYAHHNHSKLISFGWSYIHIRTLLKIMLRIEKRHEYYIPIFKNSNVLLARLLHLTLKPLALKQSDCNSIRSERIVMFDELYKSNPEDLFFRLKDHRSLIKREFFKQLKNEYANYKFEAPEVAIHVRRGDFVQLEFSTPSEYYIQVINSLREYLNYEVPIVIYSDASKEDHEISSILKLNKVRLAAPKHAVLDIIEMSKAKMLIVSNKSTFSQWAGFLSENIIISHPSYQGLPVRDSNTNFIAYEGPLSSDIHSWSPLLKKNLNYFFKANNQE